jgi:hypothetical protein
MEVPQNLKIDLSNDLEISFLDIYPKECKPGYNKDTCTLILVTALYIIVKLWKQPRCPATDQ